MKRLRARHGSIVILLLGAACGGGSAGGVGTTDSSTGTTATAATGSTGASAGGTGTSAVDTGVGADSGGDRDGSTPIDCSGAFGPPELLFDETGWEPQSLAITADELELFYVQGASPGMPAAPSRVVVRRRASRDASFTDAAPAELTELAGLCAAGTTASIDVSDNGLRLYIACSPDDTTMNSLADLRLASRPDRSSSFTLASTPIGSMVATGIGISRDELTLYTASPDLLSPGSLVHRRSALDAPFGSPMSIPGLEAVQFIAPEPTPDGLELFGSYFQSDTGGVTSQRMGVVRRASADDAAGFSSIDTTGLPVPPASYDDGSPAISADCRTLYFVRVGPIGPANPSWTVMVARR